ncbi:hypothetical protein DY932_12755 [Pseudomonas paraeruginosa]|uniref:Uncharacterized protein n=1 Tax=Pseudomonas aeruginosa TaxID=287 RepID=A0ABD7K3T0_PSEAI|nr:hypothetical protein DY932_12755 [Pseudomonas paraeruginosa]RTS46464.1 hypothetical protein DY940_15010 [Pseudomonas aeruginosa]
MLWDRQRIAGAGGQQQHQAQRKECECRAFHDEYCREPERGVRPDAATHDNAARVGRASGQLREATIV